MVEIVNPQDAVCVDQTGVHAAHCCAKHGCKYAGERDSDCPVWTEKVKQEHPCEFCDMDDEAAAPVVEQIVKWLEGVTSKYFQQADTLEEMNAIDLANSARTRASHYQDVVRGLREGAWKV
jgi:hypothetical protein